MSSIPHVIVSISLKWSWSLALLCLLSTDRLLCVVTAIIFKKTFLQEQGENNIGPNMWVTDPWPIKRQRIAYMQQRGPGCFDNHYYLQKNPDLKVIPTALELWDHFVMMGQFEGRSFRSASSILKRCREFAVYWKACKVRLWHPWMVNSAVALLLMRCRWRAELQKEPQCWLSMLLRPTFLKFAILSYGKSLRLSSKQHCALQMVLWGW